MICQIFPPSLFIDILIFFRNMKCGSLLVLIVSKVQIISTNLYNKQNMNKGQTNTKTHCRSFPIENANLLLSLISVFAQPSSYFKYGVWMTHFPVIIAIFLIEGGKPYSFLYVLAFLFGFLQFWWIQLFLTIALALCYYKFKFYQIKIVNQGTYDVGFRNVTIGSQSLAIFYSTREKGKPAPWIQTKDYFKTLYDLAFINPLKVRWVPLRIFKICTSYMSKVKIPVQTNAKLESPNPEQHEFQVILFSHGLSSNMTSYSSYCCFLASQGYIVVSLQHVNDFVRVAYDQQFVKRRKLLTKVYYMIGNQGLQARTEEMGRVYESLISHELLKCAFPQIEAIIRLKKVHFFGHSFGGATCLQTVANLSAKKVDLSLVEHILTIDPFLFPLSKQTFEHSFSQNVTIVNSETFINVVAPEFQMKSLLKQFTQKNLDKVTSYVLMGSDHIFSSDFSFVCGNGVTCITRFKNFDNRETFFAMLQLISELSLKGCGKEIVLKAADEQFICKQLVRKKISIVEEIRFLEQ